MQTTSVDCFLAGRLTSRHSDQASRHFMWTVNYFVDCVKQFHAVVTTVPLSASAH